MAIPVSIGDNMRIVLKGTSVVGEDMQNVFHYNFYAGSGTDVNSHLLENFAFGFWENIKATLRVITHNTSSYQEVECISLDADFNGVNGESFVIPVGEQPGLAAGEAAHPALCFTYRYVRPSFAFRHGFKRFGGLTESFLVGDGVHSSGVTPVENLRLALAADIGGLYPDGSPLTDPPDARPIVYRRTVESTVISPVLWGIPVGIVFSKVGTQNSRKRGHGS